MKLQRIANSKWRVGKALRLLPAYLLFATSHSLAFAAFRDQGWGTRAAGFGGAYTAVADDSQAPAYNPAGLARLEGCELSFMYGKPFAGLDLKTGTDGSTSLGMNFVSAAAPLGRWGTLGVSWTDFNVQNLYREDAYALSYAKRFGESMPLNAGVSLKRLSTAFTLDDLTRAAEATSAASPFKDGTSADALSVDAGLQFRPAEALWLGFSARNLNSPDIGLRAEDRVPREYRLGAAWTARNVGPLEELTSSLEFARRTPQSEKAETRPLFGVESWFHRKTYALRLGGNDREMAFGASLNQDFARLAMRLDYAFVLTGALEDNGGTHRLTLSLRGGAPRDADAAAAPRQRVLSKFEDNKTDGATFSSKTAKVEVYDLKGRTVWRGAGDGSTPIRWPGVDRRGRAAKGDTYVYRAEETGAKNVDYGVIVLEK